jgi:flagella basal body P-ring formation protein FlgA
MTLHVAHRFGFLKSGLILAGLVLNATSPLAADLGSDPVERPAVAGLPLRLQTSVTLNSDVIKLSDVFAGVLAHDDKIIAEAPQPGQRITLAGAWLGDVARVNNLNWQPASQFDRSVIYRPSQTVTGTEILAAVKSELGTQGLPSNVVLKPSTPVQPKMIAANASKKMAVHEAFFDEATQTFSAVVELPAGDPNAQLIPVKGNTYAIVSVPVLKVALTRSTVINADMIELADLPESKVTPDTIMDINALIGKAAKGYIRSGQSVRSNDIEAVSFISVPVLRTETHRGTKITEAHIKWIEINAKDLPENAIVDAEQLIGFSPKRQLAAGLPLRSTDVQVLNLVEVPVAARDLIRGETITADDLRWVPMDRATLAKETLLTEDKLVGMLVVSTTRTDQPFRTHGVSRPVIAAKGKLVTLIYNVPAMKLTAKAKLLEDGAVGQVVRVVNTKSNTNLFAEVIDADTVRVTDQQTASN